jgi:hypothetical protein
LISRQGDARRAGQHLASHLGAVQRPDARLDPSVVRGFVRLYARPVGPPSLFGGKVTQAREHTSKLGNGDRVRDGGGFTVLRACRPVPPVRRRSGPHRLRGDGRGRGRGRDITGEKVKPYAAGRRPPPVSLQRRTPRSPSSGEPVRAGVARSALPRHRFRSRMAWRAARTPPIVKTRGGS